MPRISEDLGNGLHLEKVGTTFSGPANGSKGDVTRDDF